MKQLVLLAVAVVAGCSSYEPDSGGGRRKAPDTDFRHGMNRAKRQKVFSDLVGAADQQNAGERPWHEIRDGAWPGVQRQYGIDTNIAEQILDEGFDSRWEQPAPAGTAEGRMNRMTWIRQRTQERGLAPSQGGPLRVADPPAATSKPKKAKNW